MVVLWCGEARSADTRCKRTLLAGGVAIARCEWVDEGVHSRMSRFENLRDYVLSQAADDWVSLDEAAHFAGGGWTTEPGITEAIGVLCGLVREGLGILGTVSSAGFTPFDWELQDLEISIRAMIHEKCTAADPAGGLVWVWYANTAEGNRIGEELLERERDLADPVISNAGSAASKTWWRFRRKRGHA